MSAVLLAFGTGTVAFPLLVIGGAVGAVSYGATLLLTREVTVSDLRRTQVTVASAVRRLSGRTA
jgi:hypothetical protein